MPRLCLTRKEGESFALKDGRGNTIATITVSEAYGNRARLVVEAPPEVRIEREDECENPT